jgi:sarcosine oxidase, subunit beta
VSSTVVILGAGVTGLSTAYHLLRRNFGRVIVLDKGAVGDGSSRRAAGIITGLLWSETGVRLRKRCLELFREFSTDLPGYRFHGLGCLNLFTERPPLLAMYDRVGAPSEVLNAAEVHTHWPQLRVPKLTIGLWDPVGGYSEPSEYVPALRQRVVELGGEIRENTPVTGIETRVGRVTGVRTGSTTLAADAVVSTLFAWTRLLLEPLGVRNPVKSFVHQRYVSRPLAAPAEIPAVNANPWSCYFRPARGGALLAGIETASRKEHVVDRADFQMNELSAAPELREELRASLHALAPALAADLVWDHERVGLITLSADGEPLLGPVRALPGLFVGAAFHSGGFAYNPGAGEALAQFVADGHTTIDVSAFAPDRFNANAAAEYLATLVPQSAAVRRRH